MLGAGAMRTTTAKKPGRRMPTVGAIARHHDRTDDRCWRCDDCAFLVRAHMIDRVFGGPDTPSNLALLCDWCHDRMGIYEPGDENAAAAYAMPADPGPHKKIEAIRMRVGEELWGKTESFLATHPDPERWLDELVNIIGRQR